jgi:hypothetical protein
MKPLSYAVSEIYTFPILHISVIHVLRQRMLVVLPIYTACAMRLIYLRSTDSIKIICCFSRDP